MGDQPGGVSVPGGRYHKCQNTGGDPLPAADPEVKDEKGGVSEVVDERVTM